MKSYSFDCEDITISDNEISFSADPMPLDQNCDYLEISNLATCTELRLMFLLLSGFLPCGADDYKNLKNAPILIF